MPTADALQFEPVGHVYSVGGRRLPSVTGVLQALDTFENVPLAFLEAAREFGSHVHTAVHLFNIDELDHDTLDSALIPYLDGWCSFLRDTRAQVIESERRVHSKRLGVAGTLDSLMAWHDLPEVIDVKTGDAIPLSVGPQTAAYRELRLEEGDIKISKTRYCVHLLGAGKYKVHKLTDARDWHIFLSCLNVYRFAKRK